MQSRKFSEIFVKLSITFNPFTFDDFGTSIRLSTCHDTHRTINPTPRSAQASHNYLFERNPPPTAGVRRGNSREPLLHRCWSQEFGN